MNSMTWSGDNERQASTNLSCRATTLVRQSHRTTSTPSTMLFLMVAQGRFQSGESAYARPQIEVSVQRL